MIFDWFTTVIRHLSGSGISKIPGIMFIYKWIYNLSIPKNRIKWIETKEMNLFVDVGDMGGVTSGLMVNKIYDPYMTKVFKSILDNKMCVVDIGANIGYFSMIASKIVGKEGCVIAFEPELNNYSILKRNLTSNNCENVITNMMAISNKNGTFKFFVDRMNCGSHSLLSPSKYVKSFAQEVTFVNTITLDSYFNNSIPKIDVIKIDVEGFETAVLDGMQKTLAMNPNIIIISEFLPHGFLRYGVLPKDYINKLLSIGFTIYNIDEKKKSLTSDFSDCSGNNEYHTNLLAIRCQNSKDILDKIL